MRIDLSDKGEKVQEKVNRDVQKILNYINSQDLNAKEEKYILLGLVEWLKETANSTDEYWWQ